MTFLGPIGEQRLQSRPSTLKSGKTGKFRNLELRSAYLENSLRSHKLKGHWKVNVMSFWSLKVESLAREWGAPGALALVVSSRLWILSSENSPCLKDPLLALAVGKIDPSEIYLGIFLTKANSPEYKAFTRASPQWEKSFPPFCLR